MMMYDSLHLCDEGGKVYLGSSELATEMAQDCALPDPAARERIAEGLLREVASDGTLADIWGHAGTIAITNGSPDALDDFWQDWP